MLSSNFNEADTVVREPLATEVSLPEPMERKGNWRRVEKLKKKKYKKMAETLFFAELFSSVVTTMDEAYKKRNAKRIMANKMHESKCDHGHERDSW